MQLLLQTHTSYDINWCFYQLFELSLWRHPFTAEDPLVSKWCNVESVLILFWRNKIIYILDGLSEYIFRVKVSFLGKLNYTFNSSNQAYIVLQ